MGDATALPDLSLAMDESWDAPAEPGRSELLADDEVEIEEMLDAHQPTSQPHERTLHALRQVRDHLIEIDLESRPSGECLEVCRNTLSSLDGSEHGPGKELGEALQELAQALAETGTGGGPIQLGRVKQSYASVAALLPELGDFQAELEKRAELVQKAILEQVPGLGPLGRSKLSAAGYDKLERLCQASQADLEAAGLAPELASRVLLRTARFKRRLDSIPPGPDRAAERRRLQRLTATLVQQNQAYDELSREWSKGSGEARRRLRDERAETMSQVGLILARLGELAAARRLERLPFDRKASELERLLSALDSTHAQPFLPVESEEHA